MLSLNPFFIRSYIQIKARKKERPRPRVLIPSLSGHIFKFTQIPPHHHKQ